MFTSFTAIYFETVEYYRTNRFGYQMLVTVSPIVYLFILYHVLQWNLNQSMKVLQSNFHRIITLSVIFNIIAGFLRVIGGRNIWFSLVGNVFMTFTGMIILLLPISSFLITKFSVCEYILSTKMEILRGSCQNQLYIYFSRFRVFIREFNSL